MEITLPIYLAGLLASALTEIIKLFPVVGKNELLKSIVAVLLCAVGGLIVVGKWNWEAFTNIVVFAFLNYKFIIQPLAKETGFRTQE